MEYPVSHEMNHDLPKTVGKSAATYSQPSNFLACIGAHELFSAELWRAALAESVATAFLMFSLIGCVVGALTLHVAEPLLIVPLIVFLNLFLFIMAMLPVTGGHMNPLITFIFVLEGVCTLTRATIYMLAQSVGSILGFVLIQCVLNDDVARKTLLVGCTISGLSPGTAFVLEFSCTFILLFIGITVAFDTKRSKELGTTMVSLILAAPMAVVVFISLTITGNPGYSGVGLNPARCFGPAVLEGSSELWDAQWIFWAGPFLACIVYYLLRKTFPKEGLVWMGDKDILTMAGACVQAGSTTTYPNYAHLTATIGYPPLNGGRRPPL